MIYLPILKFVTGELHGGSRTIDLDPIYLGLGQRKPSWILGMSRIRKDKDHRRVNVSEDDKFAAPCPRRWFPVQKAKAHSAIGQLCGRPSRQLYSIHVRQKNLNGGVAVRTVASRMSPNPGETVPIACVLGLEVHRRRALEQLIYVERQEVGSP